MESRGFVKYSYPMGTLILNITLALEFYNTNSASIPVYQIANAIRSYYGYLSFPTGDHIRFYVFII